ncbi:hypothetical protein [Streptomyces tibetensis]|uniref:hypothetical protein n=1 Tax=Streptomyces tibetensis TaxID=2382123 RepID=UPI0033F468DF
MTITEKGRVTQEDVPSDESAPVEVKEALQTFGVLLGLLALGAYTAQYWGVEEFYRQLDGLPPEYTGVDKAVLLTRFAVTSFFLALTLALVVTPVLLAYTAKGRDVRERSARVRSGPEGGERGLVGRVLRHPRLRGPAAALPIGLWMGLCSTDLDPHAVRLIPMWAVILLSWAFTGWLLWLVREVPLVPTRHKRWVTSLVIAILFTGPAGFWANDAMAYRGEQLAETGRVGSVEQWLGVRVQYVYAEFAKSEGLPQRQDGTYIHLGESGGVHVLFDCAAGSVLRVAAPQVQLTSRRDDRIAALVVTSCVRRIPLNEQRSLMFPGGRAALRPPRVSPPSCTPQPSAVSFAEFSHGTHLRERNSVNPCSVQGG